MAGGEHRGQPLTIGQSAASHFEFSASRMMPSWLDTQGVSLAFTTYEIGKLFLVGLGPTQELSFVERSFSRPMGLGSDANGFWMGALHQIWRFDNYLSEGMRHKGNDALYVPSRAYTTGDVDVHDIHSIGDEPLFVATRFNCVATSAPGKSFRAVWRPPFIDRLAAEDRCHLNGMAVDGENLRYVTCVSQSNVAEGWREHRGSGGIVIDVASGDVVASGLSMPHSPRLHDGALWLLQSGTGELGRIDLQTGRFEPVCFLPGFARGIAIHGDYAVVGVSLARKTNQTFSGLALADRLAHEQVAPRCMIAVVNLKTGDLENWIRVSAPISEIYDVAILRGVRSPHLIGLHKEDIRFVINPDTGTAFDGVPAHVTSQ